MQHVDVINCAVNHHTTVLCSVRGGRKCIAVTSPNQLRKLISGQWDGLACISRNLITFWSSRCARVYTGYKASIVHRMEIRSLLHPTPVILSIKRTTQYVNVLAACKRCPKWTSGNNMKIMYVFQLSSPAGGSTDDKSLAAPTIWNAIISSFVSSAKQTDWNAILN